MTRRRLLLVTTLLGTFVLTALVHSWPDGANAAGTPATSITTPDASANDVGEWTSLALDANGFPVVSSYDATDGSLKVLHCNDALCAAGNESSTAPDTGGANNVGRYSSLKLDASGFPVVSYHDESTGAVKILHCNDANCTGNNESITIPDSVNDVGSFSSLELDVSGFPVVGYHDDSTGAVKILHCNDVNCAGGNESITIPDAVNDAGSHLSLELDASGFPAVSYCDASFGYLKLIHCNDANCAGSNESITTPDASGDAGIYTSLELDAVGRPVVSYYDNIGSGGGLKVMHCNDANCAGNNESITTPDSVDDVGWYTSLALDSSGFPLVSYYDATAEALRLLRCNDPNCAGSNESITMVDGSGADDVGRYTSLALGSAGKPVISYHDQTNGDLKLARCSAATCGPVSESITRPAGNGAFGTYTSLAIDQSGYPVMSFYNYGSLDLMVVHCNDANCSGGDESVETPDTAGDVGRQSSLALDANGYPVLAYADKTLHRLKVMHCNDANCSGGDESIQAIPVTQNDFSPSLKLDAMGYPVVSHMHTTLRLLVLHCNDANCAGSNDSIAAPDSDMLSNTSLELDGAGNPVAAYSNSNGDVMVLHCSSANCLDGGQPEMPAGPGLEGSGVSLALDGAGNPVLSYITNALDGLVVLHCDDPDCAGTGESIATPSPDVVEYPSLEIDPAGNPVVSYYDATDGDLELLHCNDANCAGGNESLTTPDNGAATINNDVGTYGSLELDANGYPVVSYFDENSVGVKLVHCDDPNCDTNKIGGGPLPYGDTDNDGCLDTAEQQTAMGSESSGGRRNYLNFWDFYDTPNASNARDKAVAGSDVFNLLARFTSTGSTAIDPLSAPPAAPAYHTAFDRGPSSGPNGWNLTAANGSVAGSDFFALLGQFGHSCA